jgi:hypothetical protein
MFDHQMSYLIDVSKQRRKEYTDAMDYIKRRLDFQEIDFMKRKPPDSSAQSESERKELIEQKNHMCTTSITRRLKKCIHSER